MSWTEGQDAGFGVCDVCGAAGTRVWHKNNKNKWKETCQSCMSGIRSQQTFSAWWNTDAEGEGQGEGNGKGEGKGGASSSTGDDNQYVYDLGYHAGIDQMLEILIDLIGEMQRRSMGKGKGKGKGDDDSGTRRSGRSRTRSSRSRSRSDRR
jgi:hypothetical protein